jgi:peptidyl-prolyl cis-trans isomerase B (cyclophilin B)
LKSLFYGLLVFALAACGSQNSTTDSTATDTSATAESSATAATDTTPTAAPAPVEKPMSAYENKVAELHTTAGEIHIRFFPDVAPNHVRNFLELAEKGFYNGTKFHRTVPGFMIQGGDPNTINGDPRTWGTGGSPRNVRAEFNPVPHLRGIVSAARSSDPDSASSQFFIVVGDSNFLDNNYTVFGQVTKGMEVADAIVNAPRSGERPNDPVTVNSITIRDAREDEKGPAPVPQQ